MIDGCNYQINVNILSNIDNLDSDAEWLSDEEFTPSKVGHITCKVGHKASKVGQSSCKVGLSVCKVGHSACEVGHITSKVEITLHAK